MPICTRICLYELITGCLDSHVDACMHPVRKDPSANAPFILLHCLEVWATPLLCQCNAICVWWRWIYKIKAKSVSSITTLLLLLLMRWCCKKISKFRDTVQARDVPRCSSRSVPFLTLLHTSHSLVCWACRQAD